MNIRIIADAADMIVAGYAYKAEDGYVLVTDLNDPVKRSVIHNDDIYVYYLAYNE